MAGLFQRGFIPLQPLSTALADKDIMFTYLVRPKRETDPPPRPRRFRNREPETDEKPIVRQRIGSYALVTSERGLLGTVNSSVTGAPGTWALPGGGIDDGESPADAVVREVHEESGQDIVLSRLLALDSDHWVGRSTTGVLENFHSLRIIYAATCKTPSEPVVLDLGGSTARASWVPADSWYRLRWTISSRTMLTRFSDQLLQGQLRK